MPSADERARRPGGGCRRDVVLVRALRDTKLDGLARENVEDRRRGTALVDLA